MSDKNGRIYQRGEKRWGQVFSRTKQRIANNLGIISADNMQALRLVRSDELDKYDKYYEGTQYDGMPDWDAQDPSGDFLPIRKRKPRIKYNFAKVLVDRVAAKLVGEATFPEFKIEDDPETTDFLRYVIKTSDLKMALMTPVKRMLLSGSVLIRYYFVEGNCRTQSYKAKYCYPSFQPGGELESVRVQYVYEDPIEKDTNGNPKKKWYRLDLGMMSDILYNNPDYQSSAAPEFTVVEQTDHNLGWVQGEWLRTDEDAHEIDGPSLIGDILEFIDEINYSLSQSSQAVGYGQEPQLTVSGIDEDELENIIKSSSKAWSLGKEGKATFLETNLGGVERAIELRDKIKQGICDIARVVMNDPEKMAASAQSGKALEILHGPLVELVTELRPQLQKRLVNLLIKISMTMLKLNASGIETAVSIPPGWSPTSLDITVKWPEIFPQTLEDLQKKATVAVQLAGASIFSRESMTRWLAKDFGIENIEEELQKISAQPVINPFGSF